MASLSLGRIGRQPILRYRGIVFQQHSIFHRRTFSSSLSSPSSRIQTTYYTALFAISAGLFAAYYFDARSAIHRYVITPILRHTFDAEAGHKIAVQVLRSGLAPRDLIKDDDILRSEVEQVSWYLSTCTHRCCCTSDRYLASRYRIQWDSLPVLTNMAKQ